MVPSPPPEIMVSDTQRQAFMDILCRVAFFPRDPYMDPRPRLPRKSVIA